MVFVDVDDSLVGYVGGDDLLGMLKMKHFQEHETIDHLFCHGLLTSNSNFLDFVWVFGMQFLLFLLVSFGNFHWVEDYLANWKRLLVDCCELIIHFIITEVI